VDETELAEALTLRATRRARADCTLSIAGIDWETKEPFLAGRSVTIARTLTDAAAAPWIEHENATYRLQPVDPVANGKLRRTTRSRRVGIVVVDCDSASVVLHVYFGRS